MSNARERLNRFHLDRYVLGAVLTPLFATLLVAVLLLFLDQMLRLLDFIVRESGPAELVWRMLALQTPEYFSFGLPIGMFFGVLFAFRRLSLSSELTAILGAGISYRRLLVPIYLLAAPMAALTFITVGYLEPYGQYSYQQVRFAIATGAVGVRVRAGEFIDLPGGAVLGAVGEQAGPGLNGVFLEDCQDDGACEAIAATRGQFALDPDGGVRLELYDGAIVADPDRGPTGALTFESWTLPFDLPEFRARGEDEREATTGELYQFVSAPGARDDPTYNAYRSALHWRVAHSLGLFVLPLLAISMGVANPRRDSGVGPVIGIATYVAFNELLEAMERLVEHTGASPWLTIWPLLAAFAVLSVVLFLAVAERPGGRVIEPVERAWRRLRRFVIPRVMGPVRLWRKRLRAARAARSPRASGPGA